MEVDPKVVVSADARDLATVPEGSVILLLPQRGDAAWLNLQRPLVAQRSLKVVLFCDHETTVELSERAPDFFDWISQHQEAPSGPPMHAVLGLRAASLADEPIVWAGAELDRFMKAFSVAFPGAELKWISPKLPYAEMVLHIRVAESKWVAYRPRDASQLRGFRWAMAEAGRRSRAIAVTEALSCPGYWRVQDRLMPMKDAHRALKDSGASRAGALAALAGLEPEAVELARELLNRGVQEEILFDRLRGAADPGAALAREMLKVGGISHSTMIDMAMRRAPLPLLRGLAGEEEVRGLRREQLKVIERRLAKREPVSHDDLAVFAAACAAPGFLLRALPKNFDADGAIVEAMLRRKARILRIFRRPVLSVIFGALLILIAGCVLLAYLPVGKLATLIILSLMPLFYVGGLVILIIIIKVTSKADNFIKNSQVNLEKQLKFLCLAYDRGEYADVEKRLGSLLDITRAHLGIDHKMYGLCRHLYLMNLVELGDYTKALGVLEEAMADYASLSIDISFLIRPLAKILMHTGRSVEAEALLRKLLGSEASLKRIDELPSPAVNIRSMHPETNEALALFLAQPSRSDLDLKDRVKTLHLLAEALIFQGRYEEAEELLDRALELTGELPPENPEQWRARTTLGRALLLQGRRREARAVLESASAQAKAGVGESHADYALILEELARIKQPTEAATAATG